MNYAGQERGLSLYVGLIREQESTPRRAADQVATFPASYAFPNVPGKYTVTATYRPARTIQRPR